jgi:hypothetical protein
MDKKITMFLAAAILFGTAGAVNAASCKLVSGKTYYTDSVSNFSDAKCQQEIINGVLPSAVSTAGVAATGSGNCRYNSTRMQYSDGVSFFTDNKCLDEALNGETVSEPAVAQAQTQVSAISAAQYSQLVQRIAVLEKTITSMQSIMSRILVLLAQK